MIDFRQVAAFEFLGVIVQANIYRGLRKHLRIGPRYAETAALPSVTLWLTGSIEILVKSLSLIAILT